MLVTFLELSVLIAMGEPKTSEELQNTQSLISAQHSEELFFLKDLALLS